MKDGFILFYVKDNQVLPVAMSDSRLDNLQRFIPAIFNGETPKVVNKPMGEVEDLMKKNIEPIKYEMVYTINCQHEDTQCCDCAANKKEIDCKEFIADRVKEGLEDCNKSNKCYQVVK